MTPISTAKPALAALTLLAMTTPAWTAEPSKAPPPALTGASVIQFYVEPSKPAELLFKLAEGQSAEQAYTVTGYHGEPVASGTTTAAGDGRASVKVTLPAGYYEIQFAGVKQTFGVVSLPAHQGPADGFFGIDAALSWLEQDADARVGMIAAMKRSGIGFARERMGMGNINPKAGEFDFESRRKFDSVRSEYRKQGIDVLDMFDTPGPHFRSAEQPKAIRYVDQLGPLAKAWETVAKHYSPGWNALEISNEPELTPWPADQYVPLVKVGAYVQQQAGIDKPVVGGVFGGNAPGPFTTSARPAACSRSSTPSPSTPTTSPHCSAASRRNTASGWPARARNRCPSG